MENEIKSSPSKKTSRIIAHPVAFVVFVPLELEDELGTDGIEEHMSDHALPFAVVVDSEAGKHAVDVISRAAVKSASVHKAFDALALALRGIEIEVPGSWGEASLWYGALPFREV